MDTAEHIADAAVEVLARRLIIDSLCDTARDLWEMFPEVGEHDFERVIDRAQQIAATIDVPDAAFVVAYDVLAERAEDLP